MELKHKLEILADAAKYDASCASSGTDKRTSTDGRGIGSTTGMGICHSYAPDGRCISLLKILLTISACTTASIASTALATCANPSETSALVDVLHFAKCETS